MNFFANGDLRFDVTEGGDPDGSPVVLLHGFPQLPSAWDEVVPGLHTAGLRTLVPTQRGYTPAARPRDRRSYRLVALVSDVIALLDAAGIERAHLVGHDWGGVQAWGVAGLHPDRVASLTSLSTPHPAAAIEAVRTSDQGLKSWYMGAFQLPVLPELLALATLRSSLSGGGLPERYVDDYAAALRKPGALTGALNWYRGLPFSYGTGIGKIQTPTTYLWGAQDPFLGRTAAEGTAAHVGGPYEFVELEAGHWLPETQPAAITQAVIARVHSVSD